jgi:predicted kinase
MQDYGQVDGQVDVLRAGSVAVVVTGVPGSGKTTLGRALAQALEAPFLALDAIKERLYESSGGALLGVDLRLAAERELSARLSAYEGRVVVDIWIQPGRDTARVAAWLTASASRVVEVLCRVPAEVAVDRYRRRVRFGPHGPADEETLQRIRDATAACIPLGLGPCIEVDTSAPVAMGPLLDRLP